MNVSLIVGNRPSKSFKISEQWLIAELKCFIREEFVHIFDGITPKDIVIRNKSNEKLSGLAPVIDFRDETGTTEFIVDEPDLRYDSVSGIMTEVEQEFVSLFKSVKHGEAMTLIQFMGMSESNRIQWYGELSAYIEHTFIIELKSILGRARRVAVSGTFDIVLSIVHTI